MYSKLRDLLDIDGVMAAGIVAVSIIAAFLVEFCVRKTFLALARKTKTDLDDKIVQALRRPIFLSVLFFGLFTATSHLGLPDIWQTIVNRSLKTLAILVWSSAAFRISSSVLQTIGRMRGASSIIQPGSVPVFDMLVKLVVVGGAVYFMFLAWNINVTAWLASAGIVGIAVGFAAKDTLANLFSGIFILADAPYKVDDFIVLDDGLRGQVTRIGLRSTRILTRDDVEITVPNAVIGNSKIVNEAGGRHVKQRIRVKVSVAYGSDIDQARATLYQCVEGADLVCDDPPPEVRFRAFGGSGLDFELLVWIDDPAKRGRILDDLNCRVYKALGVADIEIPYSKHDVYIKEMVAAE